jgi:hypothetical protein
VSGLPGPGSYVSRASDPETPLPVAQTARVAPKAPRVRSPGRCAVRTSQHYSEALLGKARIYASFHGPPYLLLQYIL